MRLLIVDDEAHWVDNLSTTKPWHSLGIREVYSAYTPYEALKVAETRKVDIVITDIVMPEIGGMELIERLRRTNGEIKCILLSGYSDFQLAKQAIQRQAVDYLLKPPTDEELFGAVRNAVEQIQRSRAVGGSVEPAGSALRERAPDRRVWSGSGKAPELQQALQTLDLPPSLAHLLEAGRWETVEEKLIRLFEELEGPCAGSWEHCMEAGFRIASSYSSFAHQNGCSLAELLGLEFDSLPDGGLFYSVAALRAWSLHSLQKLKEWKEHSCAEPKATRSLYVKKIQAFVDNNLYLDVSLRAMADYVNLHPTHLSKIYKMETGEGISDYVFRLRMEKACYLLKTTGKKVYEIGLDIGYMDPAYFIKVFKRKFGFTPQQFRDRGFLA